MPLTRANLQEMLQALQNLNDAIPQVITVGNQADDALTAVQASWQSPTAAPAFYQRLGTWQNDHQELKTMLINLTQALSDVHTDLLKKEQTLTS